jgi:hypothetical protein
MTDLTTTRELLAHQLTAAIEADPLAALPTIAALQRETDEHLRAAVRRASAVSSWREIAAALGVSKQAAHQRFKVYAKDVATEIRTEHRAMKRSGREGDVTAADAARARRDALAADLKTAARSIRDEA